MKQLTILLMLIFFFGTRMVAQVTATGHVFAEVVDDMTSVSALPPSIALSSNTASISTSFSIDGSRDIEICVLTQPAAFYDKAGNSFPAEQDVKLSSQKDSKNIQVGTAFSATAGEYKGTLSVIFAYN